MSLTRFENERWSRDVQKPVFRHAAALELVEPGTALDVGCGDGLLLSMLKRKGVQATGVDISEVAAARARAAGFDVSIADFSDAPLPFADHSFDTAIALDVLEHVYDPDHLFAEMARVSRRSVVISVPNFSSLPARLQVLFGAVPENNRPNKGHLYWFTWLGLNALANRHGFVISRARLNAQKEHMPVIGALMRTLAMRFPGLFALSFVVECSPRA